VMNDDLMVRVIESKAEEMLNRRHVREMDFTGRPLKSFVYVSEEGYKKLKDLSYWVDMGLEFVDSLPPKAFEKKKAKSAGAKKGSAKTK